MYKRYIFITLFILATAFSTTTFGITCTNQDGCTKQIVKLYKYAKAGNTEAQILLGVMYTDGKYIEQNVEQGFNWYKKAAKRRFRVQRRFRVHSSRSIKSVAEYLLGMSYFNGTGTKKDIKKSFIYLKRAAKVGHTISQLTLALENYKGELIEQDLTTARYWFEKAAEGQNPQAAFNLAKMAELGLGGDKNLHEAQKWYLAASQVQYQDAALRLSLLPSPYNMQILPSENSKPTNNTNESILNDFEYNLLLTINSVMSDMELLDDFLLTIDSIDYRNINHCLDLSGCNTATRYDHLRNTILDYYGTSVPTSE